MMTIQHDEEPRSVVGALEAFRDASVKALRQSPEWPSAYVRDLCVRWALEESQLPLLALGRHPHRGRNVQRLAQGGLARAADG
jgi:hypothetical protein